MISPTQALDELDRFIESLRDDAERTWKVPGWERDGKWVAAARGMLADDSPEDLQRLWDHLRARPQYFGSYSSDVYRLNYLLDQLHISAAVALRQSRGESGESLEQIWDRKMHDRRKTGALMFNGPGLNERTRVLWELESGEIADGKTWTVAISFTRDWRIPKEDNDLLFKAMSEPDIRMWLQTDDGVTAECLINDIDGMEDGGVLLGSPDLGGERITFNKPEPPAKTEKKRRPWPFRWPFG